jgi:hypothetical protein
MHHPQLRVVAPLLRMPRNTAHVNDLTLLQYPHPALITVFKKCLHSIRKRNYLKASQRGADMNNTDTPAITPDSIRETATAFQRSRIPLTTFASGIFTAQGDAKKTAEESRKMRGCAQEGRAACNTRFRHGRGSHFTCHRRQSFRSTA